MDSGGECHYKEPLQSLFNFISMTKLKLVLFPNTMTCASAHVIAINDQEILKPFIDYRKVNKFKECCISNIHEN